MRVQPIRTLLNKIPYGALPWESFGLPITWAAESLTAASTSALVLVGSTYFQVTWAHKSAPSVAGRI